MKKLLMLFVVGFSLVSCAPATQERVVNESLESLKPCILDLAFTQDIEAAKVCAKAKAVTIAEGELELALGDYLATAKGEVLEPLYFIFDVDSPKALAAKLVDFLKEYRSTEAHERLEFPVMTAGLSSPALDGILQALLKHVLGLVLAVLSNSAVIAPLIVVVLSYVPSPLRTLAKSLIDLLLEKAKEALEARKEKAIQDAVDMAEQLGKNKSMSGDEKKLVAMSHVTNRVAIDRNEASDRIEAEVKRLKNSLF